MSDRLRPGVLFDVDGTLVKPEPKDALDLIPVPDRIGPLRAR
jgi:hypothetical protein